MTENQAKALTTIAHKIIKLETSLEKKYISEELRHNLNSNLDGIEFTLIALDMKDEVINIIEQIKN